MRKLAGMILTMAVSGCATTPETEPVATIETLPPTPVVQQTSASSVMTTTLPYPEARVIKCQPKLDEASASHFAKLGYTITRIELEENSGDRAKITIRRQSTVGAIPMHPRQFPSSRYHAEGSTRYGEWEDSEHWIRLGQSDGGFSGKFIYEGDFAFSVDCE